MSTSPLVSAILPTYNAGKYLSEAVRSILTQNHRDLELLVIDDGSTDGSVDQLSTIQDPRLFIYTKSNGGKSSAVNYALDRIRGEFWCLQDADDLSYPDRFAVQVAALKQEQHLAAVFIGIDHRVGDKAVAPRVVGKTPEECRKYIAEMRLLAHDATGMYRTSLTAGMRFDDELRICQGVDFILRLGERHPVRVLDGCYYSHRLNLGSVTHKSAERNLYFSNLVAIKACARRGIDPAPYLQSSSSAPSVLSHRRTDNFVPSFIESIQQLRQKGKFRDALSAAWFSISRHPLDPLYYKPLLHLMAPLSLRRLFGRRHSR